MISALFLASQTATAEEILIIESTEKAELVATQTVAEAAATQHVPSESRSYSWYAGKKGYEKALKEQESTGRSIAVYFYADWCQPCKEFTKNVLNKNKVQDALRHVTKVRINIDQARLKGFKYEGIPAFFIARPDGKKIPIFSRTPNKFIQECKKAGL